MNLLKARLFFLVWGALVTPGPGAALTPSEWEHRQVIVVREPGLTKLAIPPATFDAASPDLADLRVVDPEGREVAWFAAGGAPATQPVRRERPKSFRIVNGRDSTQLVIESGHPGELASLELETGSPFFLQAAHVEISDDGVSWQSLGPAVPLFRQFGAEQLTLSLRRKVAPWVRVTLADLQLRPVTFTGVWVQAAEASEPASVPVTAKVTRREEFAGETVLTVALDGRHLPLAELRINAIDPLFMRRVTVTMREADGAEARERVVGQGTIYRVAVAGAPASAEVGVPMQVTPATRELLVHVHNGDSPPLQIEAVEARQRRAVLYFMAGSPGEYALLTGNPGATAPHYDLAGFSTAIRAAPANATEPGELTATPDYRARESLARVDFAGAPLDTQDWLVRRQVSLGQAGVQELELDAAALAASRTDCGDVRLMQGGNQRPYVLERPDLSRALAVTLEAERDPKRPRVSLWRVVLPSRGLPLSRLVLASETALFKRKFRIYEKLEHGSGGTFELTLAAGTWSRTPNPSDVKTRSFDLSGRLRSDELWIETDNGDNAPIVLSAARVIHPVVRLVFKVTDPTGLTLVTGREAATAPSYDLGLVAEELLTSARHAARLDQAESPRGSQKKWGLVSREVIFWAALGLVVVVLLVVVARLLPKPPAT